MQIAIVGAGYTGGEADQLRRDMAAWRRNGKLERHRERLLAGFEKTGIAREFGERLYQSIEGFGEYGFPESHAASFALLVYASSWLKVHHPAAFAAALVNSQPMGFYSPGTHREGRRAPRGRGAAGARRRERLGLHARGRPEPARRCAWGCAWCSGLGEEPGGASRRRGARGRSRAWRTWSRAARLDKRELEALAHAGALVGFGLGRREAMWKVRAPRRGRDLFAGRRAGRRDAGAAADVARRAAGARLRDDGRLGGRPRDEGRAPAPAAALQERAATSRRRRTARA